MPQEPQELHKPRVTPRRWRSGTPKVCFGKFLRDHLKVVQRMTLCDALSTEQDKGFVVGFCLFPPEFLLTIHFRIELRCRGTNCREVVVLAS